MPAYLEVVPLGRLQLRNTTFKPGRRGPYPLMLVATGEDWHVVQYLGERYKLPIMAVATPETIAAQAWIAAGCPMPGPCGPQEPPPFY